MVGPREQAGAVQGSIRVERRDAAAIVWLDNPARRNALTRSMLTHLFSALRELDADPRVGCILIRGAEGTFCSGLDLTSLGTDETGSGTHAPASGEQRMLDLAHRLEQVLAGLRTLSIAVVEGHAVGAGCQIALGCTLRLAAPRSSFAIPVGRLGLVYPPLSIQRLVELVGGSRAALMLATGRPIDAATAHAWGLATDLIGDHCAASGNTLQNDLDTLVADVAAGSRLSLEAGLEMVRAVGGDPRAAGRTPQELYHHWSSLSEATGEHAEALRARAEGRAPAFAWHPEDTRPDTPAIPAE